MDLSGNGRVGTRQVGTINVGSVTGSGVDWSVPYVRGTTGTQISWGSTSIPSEFTICNIILGRRSKEFFSVRTRIGYKDVGARCRWDLREGHHFKTGLEKFYSL
jgi:hypothetical protein